MKRIAAELGVSTTTVSKVLNDQPDIGKATRARVLARVEELGYRPNAVAHRLRQKKTRTIGLVVPDNSNPFFAEVAKGVDRHDLPSCLPDPAAERAR